MISSWPTCCTMHAAVKYDYAREVKEEREKKQRKLKEIDEARKKANGTKYLIYSMMNFNKGIID